MEKVHLDANHRRIFIVGTHGAVLYFLPLQWCSFNICYHIMDEFFAGQDTLLQGKNYDTPPMKVW